MSNSASLKTRALALLVGRGRSSRVGKAVIKQRMGLDFIKGHDLHTDERLSKSSKAFFSILIGRGRSSRDCTWQQIGTR